MNSAPGDHEETGGRASRYTPQSAGDPGQRENTVLALRKVYEEAPIVISSAAYLELALKIVELVRTGMPERTERRLKRDWILGACSFRVRREIRKMDGGLTTSIPDQSKILIIKRGRYYRHEQRRERTLYRVGPLALQAYQEAQKYRRTNQDLVSKLEASWSRKETPPLLAEDAQEEAYAPSEEDIGRLLPWGNDPRWTHATGIVGAACLREVAERPSQRLETAKNGDISVGPEKVKSVTPVSREVDTGPNPPLRVRKALRRQTCEEETREAIFEHVPEAGEDDVLFRWCAYALWTDWTDRETGLRVIHYKILHWIGHYRFDTSAEVLSYIDEHLPIKHTNNWAKGSHCRQIIDDGLPAELWKAVELDLCKLPSEYDRRVYVLSGERATDVDPSEIRSERREEIEGMRGPSPTSQRIWKEMNDVPSHNFARFQDQLDEAMEHVDRMEIDVELSARRKGILRMYTGCEKKDNGTLEGNVARYKARLRHEKRKEERRQRSEYRGILQDIEDQHKPFYEFSSKGRTDRIFSYNNSALLLPSEVRDILCEGLYEVDLKSAHLFIAAWLWDAEKALERLTQDGYSVWDDLMEYLRPLFEERGLGVPEKGDALYEEVKGGLKVMLYSIVYGMPAPSMQAEVTKTLKPILGPDVGKRLRSHLLIQELIQKRDEKLQAMEPGDTLEGPSGITITVEKELGEEDEDGQDRVGPKTALAAIAQSYEQELMSVLLDVAEDRTPFQPLLWLHDGSACRERYTGALKDDLEEALKAKRKELTEFAGKDELIPAEFEIEEIEAPDLPPENIHDRVASAGGGALRLKEGETAVKIDPEDGRELGQQILLKTDHELYRIASAYVRITDDGYTIESDPYPEEQLWELLTENENNSTSSKTASKKSRSTESRREERTSESPPARPAERQSRETSTSRGSDQRTAAAASGSENLSSKRGAADHHRKRTHHRKGIPPRPNPPGENWRGPAPRVTD